jgi:glycerophosphoryl diester phosphodiesterase
MRRFYIFCCIIFAFSQTNAQVSVSKSDSLYKQFLDLPYSKDDEADIMDLYMPNTYTNAKVIVYLHGSGWTGGDKKEFPKQLIDELVGKRKYIVVSANYRLIKEGKNRFPAQMEDINKIFTFLVEKASQYHFNGTDFALMGGSAGAHLAMLYAYGYDKEKRVKTVVDFWGPTDLVDKTVRIENKDANAKVENLLGTTDQNAQICFDASPYYRLSASTGVPTILFHGGQDPLVPVSQADKLHTKLLELKIPTEYAYYPNEKHGMKGAAGIDVLIKTLAWLNKYFPAN